ncbi:unnamed protein product, partial [Mesorhabditis spiculigera]
MFDAGTGVRRGNTGWLEPEIEALYRLLEPLYPDYQEGQRGAVYKEVSQRLKRMGIQREPTQVQKRLSTDHRRLNEIVSVTKGQVDEKNLPKGLVALYRMMAGIPSNLPPVDENLLNFDQPRSNSMDGLEALDDFLDDDAAGLVQVKAEPMMQNEGFTFANGTNGLPDAFGGPSHSRHTDSPAVNQHRKRARLDSTNDFQHLPPAPSSQNSHLILQWRLKKEQKECEFREQKLKHEAEKHEMEMKLMKAKLASVKRNSLDI